MYEHHTQPLLSMRAYLRRQAIHVALAAIMVACSLLIGMAGYHGFENLSWVDSLVNASMILGGMGPVNSLNTNAGKIFASFYALYSGIIFLVIAGVMFAPVFHRFLHRFHLADESRRSK